MRRFCLAACLVAAPAVALAADPAAKPTTSYLAPGYDLMVTLGAGAEYRPDYEGSDNYSVGVMPIVGLKFRTNPLTGQPTSDTGFGIAPAFRYLAKRDNHDERAGLDEIDAAFELGLKLSWTEETWRVFVEGRQGMGGHSGQVFDLGADVILRPTLGVTASIGPRLSFATSDYVETYFDVSAAESAASGGRFAAYSADAGLKSYGVGARVDYELTPQWLIRMDASYTRLADDLANSPVVKQIGSADQFSIGLGAAYRFGINWR